MKEIDNNIITIENLYVPYGIHKVVHSSRAAIENLFLKDITHK